MKLPIVSDVHLSCGPLSLPAKDADAVIAAGDISRPQEAVAWLQGLHKPVLYIAGNHEFYGDSMAGIRAELRRLCAGTNIRFLDNEEIVLDRVRFLAPRCGRTSCCSASASRVLRRCAKRSS